MADARLGARIIGRQRLVFGNRLLDLPLLLKGAGIEQMTVRGFPIGPAATQVVERCARLGVAAEPKFGAGAAQHEAGVLAERHAQDRVELLTCLVEPAKLETFLAQRL